MHCIDFSLSFSGKTRTDEYCDYFLIIKIQIIIDLNELTVINEDNIDGDLTDFVILIDTQKNSAKL